MATKSVKKRTCQTIALTGGTGFLGKHQIESLLEAGYKVKALTRRSQPEKQGVEWILGDLENTESLQKLCEGVDTLVHVAGLVKAVNRDTFFDINVKCSKVLFDIAASEKVNHVIQVSSLAAREPRLSHYGASKAGAELLLTARKWPFTWTIVRPPAIYGPGDTEILKLIKATKLGILPAPGSTANRFSMIHVHDMASAITELCDGSNPSGVLEIDDGKTGGYQLKDVALALSSDDSKPPKTFSLPFWVMGAIGAINGMIASAINRPAMLTLSTARYLCHPDWTVREPRRPRLANWSPKFDLKAGLSDTMDWYKKNGLL
ncbi:MAG: NAD-dependent epimerase/dehydratase family protein [Kordiimonas sp.]